MEDPHSDDGTGSEPAASERLGRDLVLRAGGALQNGRPAIRHVVPEFSDLVLACRHRPLLLAVAGAILSAALVALAWQWVPVSYEATSLVRVRQRQEVVFTPQTTRADDAAFVRAQQQLVVAPQVLAAALHDEEIRTSRVAVPAHGAADWLKRRVRVDIQPGAEVMRITVQHPESPTSQLLCNAVTRAYLQEVTSNLAADRQRRTGELERAAQSADQRLDELWGELNRVAASVGADSSQSLTIRDEIQLQAYREYAQQLRRAQLRGNELQSLLTEEQLKLTAGDDALEPVVEEQLRSHPDMAAVRSQLADVDARIAQLRGIAAQDDSPRLTRLHEDRALLADKIESIRNDLRPEIRAWAAEQRRREAEQSIAQLRRQLELNQTERDFLHSRMEEIDTATVRSGAPNGIQLEMARHALDRQTRLADALSQTLEEFRIESQSQLPVALIEWAPQPGQANRSRQLKAAAGAAGIGGLLAILGVGALEWRGHRVRNGEDVRSHFAHPVFGIQALKDRRAGRGRAGAASGAREAAARLMLGGGTGRGPHVASVMVSSALSCEPRHLVTLAVARALRDFRRRTLIVDCDVSGTSLSQILGVAHLPGLTQLQADRVDAQPYIIPAAEEGLDFLPAGTPRGASAWVDPVLLRATLETVRRDYDAVVVNGPAMMSSAESLLLASHVEQVILAVFPGTSCWDDLAAAEEMASQAGMRLLGAVLHASRESALLQLQRSCPGPSPPTAQRQGEPEERVQAEVAALQRELERTGPVVTTWPTESTDNMELTS